MLVDADPSSAHAGAIVVPPANADIKERGVLAIDALRYSMNIPSVQMQYLVGSQTTANFAQELGIAGADYIMGRIPPLPRPRLGAGQPDEHDAGVLHFAMQES